MKSIKRDARVAGLLYLITVISGIISLAYVPSKLIAWDNPVETYDNIKSKEALFKLGILSDLILYTTFIFLALSLYKLLQTTNRSMARTMVVLALISVPISYVNLISKLDILSLINMTEIASNIHYSEVMTLLDSHNNGILIVEVFWGLWLFPFGLLVYNSRMIPKIWGVFLMIACFGYLIDFLGYFIFSEDFVDSPIPLIASLSQALGEIGICLWLLIVGVKENVEEK